MKKITIPPTCKLKNADKSEISFAWFVGERLCSDSKHWGTGRLILRAVKLSEAVSDVEPGGIVHVDDEDYTRLVACCDDPSENFSPVFRQVSSMFEAIYKAEDGQ